MDEKRLAEKKRYAGEKKPSMKRSDDFNDYRDRRMYMITIEVTGRQPLLGTVEGNPSAPDGSDDAPHVVPTPLGKRVEQEWRGIPNYYPQIEVVAFQLMPDHIHGILFVHERIPVHIGHVIGGFKTGCNRAARELAATTHLAAAQPQPTQNPAVAPSAFPSGSPSLSPSGLPAVAPSAPSGSPSLSPSGRPAVAPSAFPSGSPSLVPSAPGVFVQAAALPLRSDGSRGLFEQSFNDLILKNREEFQHWKHYLADNPRRLLLKRAHPEFLKPFFGFVVGGYTLNGVGNRALLQQPYRLSVRISRRITGSQLDDLVERYLQVADRGALLVSPSLSPGEKRVMRAAFDRRLPTVVIVPNGFTPLTKPRGEQFDACCQGRLLILSAREHSNQTVVLTKQLCEQMNLIAYALSNYHF